MFELMIGEGINQMFLQQCRTNSLLVQQVPHFEFALIVAHHRKIVGFFLINTL